MDGAHLVPTLQWSLGFAVRNIFTVKFVFFVPKNWRNYWKCAETGGGGTALCYSVSQQDVPTAGKNDCSNDAGKWPVISILWNCSFISVIQIISKA